MTGRWWAAIAVMFLAVFGLLGANVIRLSQHSRPAIDQQKEGENEAAEIRGYFEWIQMSQRGEDGTIDPKGRLRAVRQMQQLSLRQTDLSQVTWFNAGPTNIPGRALCVKSQPSDPNHILLATAGGGLWTSFNKGQSWTPSASLPNCAVSWIEFDPNNENTVWLTTGEAYGGPSGIPGIGIYKSKDGGSTWVPVQSTPIFGYSTTLSVMPGNSNTIFICTFNGIWRSTNGGVNFTNVDPSSAVNLIFLRNSSRIIAAGHNPGSGYCAKYSDDFGATWQVSSGFDPQTGDRDVPGNRLAIVGQSGSGLPKVYCMRGSPNQYDMRSETYLSTDGGTTFVKQNGGTLRPDVNTYCTAFTVDPTHPEHLLAAGTFVYESWDYGQNWIKIGGDLIHADVHYLNSYIEGTTLALDVTTDGGYYHCNLDYSTRIWTIDRPQSGVVTAQFWSLSAVGSTLEGGTQDNGTILTNMSNRLGKDYPGGDGGGAAIDPTNPLIAYGTYQNLKPHRTMDGGATYQGIWSSIPGAGNEFQSFVPLVQLDPNDHQRLFVASHSIYRSDDPDVPNPDFVKFKNILNGSINEKVMICSMGFGKVNATSQSKTLYVGYTDGSLERINDRTSDFPTIDIVEAAPGGSRDQLPDRAVTAIFVDPFNDKNLWVGLGGYANDNLWKSTNGGTTWTSIKGSYPNTLPWSPILSIVRNNGGTMMHVGTEVGLVLTTDNGLNWRRDSDHFIGVPIRGLQYWNGDSLAAATHGRGMWYQRPLEVQSIEGASSIPEGVSTTMKVVLTGPTDVERKVYLTSSNPNATVFPYVKIPANATEATFGITTKNLMVAESTVISARILKEPISKTVAITLRPDIATISASPSAVTGGDSFVLHVDLDKPVTDFPYSLTVNSDSAYAPTTTVNFPVGSKSVNALVFTSPTAVTKLVTYSAVTHGVTKSGTLTVKAPAVAGVTLSTNEIEGGSPTRLSATVTLNHVAPPGGIKVTMDTTSPAVVKASAFVIPEGAISGAVPLSHFHQSNQKTISVYAKTESNSKSTSLLVTAATLTELRFNVAEIIGGGRTGRVTGTLELQNATHGNAFDVPIYVNTSSASIPAYVRVPAGSNLGTFSVNTNAVLADESVLVAASTYHNTVQGSFLLKAPTLLAFAISPTAVQGGSGTAVIGTVKLNGIAPGSGIYIDLTSGSRLVTVPATVRIGPGQTTATFPITYGKPTILTVVKINAGALSANLTIKP